MEFDKKVKHGDYILDYRFALLRRTTMRLQGWIFPRNLSSGKDKYTSLKRLVNRSGSGRIGEWISVLVGQQELSHLSVPQCLGLLRCSR